MITLSHNESILFRLLAGFFGEERVVPHMSLFAVCGGEVPTGLNVLMLAEIQREAKVAPQEWARQSKCLFTIVDNQDQPKLVMEFVADFSSIVDLRELTRRRYIEPFLEAAGVRYLTVSPGEFSEITDPGGNLDFFHFLQSKFEVEIDLKIPL
ncbi:MAG: hypothetical protein DCC75_01580 [Proteobacteria bacterium]|nr:MAG: hypothetical protein DCC75_01580 [Pseudomonadota bacterium]